MAEGLTVQTVRGPVAVSELGRVLPHEHVACDLFRVTRQMGLAALNDPDEAVRDLKVFKELGGGSVVEATSGGLGRKPGVLRSVSERADVHIVMGCGWYREPYYEEDMNKAKTAELTERLLIDIAEGEDGVRPGVIGEIGADREWVSGVEERVLRAAARAQRETGLGLILHAVKSEVGAWQLDVLEDEGCDLSRVAVGHCDTYPDVDYHERLAERGAMVMYDGNGPGDRLLQEQRIANAAELVRRGWGKSLLMSHDVCVLGMRERRGGPGYSYVLRQVGPDLIAAGVPEDVVETIFSENPLQLLVGQRPGGN
ncbi:hypothetical protein [Spongiactinospora sp. TRM90649]|uniref:phosphotriesterase family protein n=1 Tax=Spongiactinospora sp. TRM90649 TaxID=3031114 RepID=UPI0023F709DF|nr:hypothetical protein [Spongiactinospora sp. TRM90649]MDF5753182.1 hypothetical protein [Spongiactinospora sp. TRM90649]